MTPGAIDVALIRRHLLALDTALQALQRHTDGSIEVLRTDIEEAWIVERGLQLCAQNCIDIATHLAAATGHDVPDYAAAIDLLAVIGVITSDFARTFRGIAGFRNVLVHGYLAIDPEILHRLLNERLDDFRRFARSVEEYLTASSSRAP